ncbi:MAG TPA: energy-coupling factor transporter transmembrane protein EcfT [Bacilli bacterium]|nr:energy-coupling factor transporter transmembrane protein EcfT [Bacilli bacterium]
MQNITLGRYIPFNSFIHRADPRLKLFSVIVIMVMVFFRFSSTEMNFIMYGILGLLILALMLIAHIRIRSLFRQLKALWMMMIILLIINIFTFRTAGDKVWFTLFNYSFYYSPFIQTAYIFLRLVLMIALTMVLTGTTRPLDLTYALEWYMYPLKFIHFPVHEVAMTISIALRFIPTLLDETGRIMKAQESRGVDFKKGKIKERLRAIVALIIPLFISAFQRSDDLANAMEARGYNPSAKRTRYRILKWRPADTLAFVLTLATLGAFIYLDVAKVDFYLLIKDLINVVRGLF